MTIHSMSPRAHYQTTYGAAEDMYHDLRAQGVPAGEAWQRVRTRFPAPSNPSPVSLEHQSTSQADQPNKSVGVADDDQPTVWSEVGWGPIVLMTALWLLEQAFWAVVWMIGFTLRVLVGIFWFGLGLVAGFLFSRR